MKVYTPEKIMAERNIHKLFLNNNMDNNFMLNEWNIKTNEEKQEFIAKYIESLTFIKDKNSKYGIRLIDLKFKSLYIEKINNLTSIGASESLFEIICNDKRQMVTLSCPLKEFQLKKYLEELKEYKDVRFYEHPIFNYSIYDIPDNVEININENKEILKLIPILKDKDNIDNIRNKFKLEIVTSIPTVELNE